MQNNLQQLSIFLVTATFFFGYLEIGSQRKREYVEDTDALIDQAANGDISARTKLLARHRDRLTRMVTMRMDPCLAPRFDPSDVVQETLIVADARLEDYLRSRVVAFYPWLRKLATERLIRLREEHLQAKKRSVRREIRADLALSNESVSCLAGRLADNVPSPSENMVRDELRRRIHTSLKSLRPKDREILELLYLEQLKTAEVADVLEISPGNVRARHFRALNRLAQMLENHEG